MAPANSVESGILELASHIHSWYIAVEATAANVVGLIGSDHQAVDAAREDQSAVKGLHVDDIAPTTPDQTTLANGSLSVVRKAGNRSILKTNSFHRSQPTARHIRWDPSTYGRTGDASCSKPACKKVQNRIRTPEILTLCKQRMEHTSYTRDSRHRYT